jgi:hypothetical protein
MKSKLVVKQGVRLLSAAALMSGTSACAVLGGESVTSGDKGRILISADADGMQAFGDMIQGAITNGKASPDTDTAHYGVRREQVRTKALRYSSFGMKPGGEK